MDLAAHALTLGGPWALVALFFIMVWRGELIPRRTYDDMVKDRDEWRTAHTVSETGRHEVLRQNGELLEAVHTANHVLTALPQPKPAGEVSHADPHPATPA